MKTLNEALRLVRRYHKISQAHLARDLGLSRSFVCELEAGSKSASIETIRKYADYFSLPLSSLMLFAETMEGGCTSERVRVYAGKKVVEMLDWIAGPEFTTNDSEKA